MTVSEVKKYECTVLIDASCGVTVEASSPEEAAELAENAAAEQGAGSLCHQCSDHTECGDSYAVIVYDGGEEVLDTDYRSAQLKAAQSELAALREELADLADLKAYVTLPLRERCAERKDLQQRLTAAEQRNETLETALITALDDSAEDAQSGEIVIQYEDYEALVALVAKPTESGASEIAKRALSFENQRIHPALFKCLACGDYHEGSGNLPCPKMSPMSGVKP
jgi:DNA repair exonuclease SbcCD ATPase subunit